MVVSRHNHCGGLVADSGRGALPRSLRPVSDASSIFKDMRRDGPLVVAAYSPTMTLNAWR